MAFDIDIGSLVGLNGVNVGGVLDKIITFFLILGSVLFLGAVFYFIYTKKKKLAKQGSMKKIGWWEEGPDRLIPGVMDEAEEIIIPGTPLAAFYIKSKNLWLPRFSKAISPGLYYVARTKMGEIVNFVVKSLEKDMKEAGLEFDHTDMKWAAENLRDFIKRNYKDKSIPWWKEYKEVISTVILLLAMTFCFVIIIFFMRDIIKDLGSVSTSVASYLDKANACESIKSGLVTAAP